MFSYCLFCHSARCDAIRQFIESTMNVRVIQPKWIQRKWVRGHEEADEKSLLPGYLFLYSEEALVRFHEFWRADGVIRIVGYANNEYVLQGADRDFAEMLLSTNGRIGNVKVYQVGDRLKLADGYLSGYEGVILKVDRQRQRLQMQFDFDHAQRKIWVGYDMADKPNHQPNLERIDNI